MLTALEASLGEAESPRRRAFVVLRRATVVQRLLASVVAASPLYYYYAKLLLRSLLPLVLLVLRFVVRVGLRRGRNVGERESALAQ